MSSHVATLPALKRSPSLTLLERTHADSDQEFVRVGYYQNTEYDTEEWRLQPPPNITFDRLTRELASKPKVTRFMIKWFVAVHIFMFSTLLEHKLIYRDADETAPSTQTVFGGDTFMANGSATPGSEFPRSTAFLPSSESHNYAATSSSVPPASSMAQ